MQAPCNPQRAASAEHEPLPPLLALLHPPADILQQHLARMMARPNVAEQMGWEEEEEGGAAAARRRAEEAEEEVVESEDEEAARRPAPTAEERAAAKAAAADENEIELEEDEEEGAEGEEGAAGAAGAAGEPAMDAELEALARAPGPADVAREAAAAAKARAAAAARGEPRSWDDLSDGEQEGEPLCVLWLLCCTPVAGLAYSSVVLVAVACMALALPGDLLAPAALNLLLSTR